METRVSTNGQVVLPGPVRRRLGLLPGDPLNVKVEGGRIVLTPRRSRSRKDSILLDPVTGLPVLDAGQGAPLLSSKQVQEILSSGKEQIHEST
jgi:AbrB family looped-hinge helix DNA binding protein